MSGPAGAVPAPSSTFIGVDVGTGSARAGVFDGHGEMLGSAAHDIALWRDGDDIVEQSSDDIWRAVVASVREAVDRAGVDPALVGGIGFDATCSLVVLGPGGGPLAVGPSDDPQRNVIVWMDHRAVEEAERINALGHDVLRYVGGVISPEMETPKLAWLRRHRPDTYRDAWRFFDLADYLTWRASGDEARSACTVTCKWTYLAHESRWDPGYFRSIGLGDLADDGFVRIGRTIVPPGRALGRGLTDTAATALGLRAGTPVAAGLIDAHAGGVGTVGVTGDPLTTLGYVFGTSSCTMTSTLAPTFVPGVWGPYFDAMVPGLWLNEGGQSAAGAAIDQLVAMHPAAAGAAAEARAAGSSLAAWLGARADAAVSRRLLVVDLAGGRHVVPEFLGNRAPFADPHARAIIAGLGMASDVDDLVGLYVAGLCGVGYGLRQIVETQDRAGVRVARIVVSGGAGRSPLIRQVLADATGIPVVAVTADEPVLLGAAMLGAVAGGAYPDVRRAMTAMCRGGDTHLPDASVRARHDWRFDAFRRLQDVARQIAATRPPNTGTSGGG